MNDLNKKDLQLINKFMQRASLLDKKYQQLCYLEVNGQKDSDSYLETLEASRPLLVDEQKLYDDPYLTSLKSKELSDYLLLNDSSFEDFMLAKGIAMGLSSKNDMYILEMNNSAVLRRIITKLYKQSLLDYSHNVTKLPDSLIETLKTLTGVDQDQIIKDIIKNGFEESREINEALEKDYLQMFLSLVEEYKKNSKDSRYRDALTIVKYNVASTSGSIETDLLDSNFNIDDTVYVGSKLIIDLMHIPPLALDKIKSIYGSKEASHQIFELLQMSNKDYCDPKKGIIAIIRQCLLRSALLFLDNDMINIVHNHFISYTENSSYLRSHSANSKGRETVASSFEKISDDRKKQKVISFDPNYRIDQ